MHTTELLSPCAIAEPTVASATSPLSPPAEDISIESPLDYDSLEADETEASEPLETPSASVALCSRPLASIEHTPQTACSQMIDDDPVLRFYLSDPDGFDSLFERQTSRDADMADAVVDAWMEAGRYKRRP